MPPLETRSTGLAAGARSSAVEHYLDTVGVTGSIPVAPTRQGTIKIAPSTHLPSLTISVPDPGPDMSL